MAIYTRFGSEVKLTAARLIPVWIEKLPGETKWHYAPAKPSKRTQHIDESPMWHVKGEYLEGGEMCGGKWQGIFPLVATDGWAEIQAECERLNPTDAANYQRWNTKTGPQMTDLFKIEPAKNIA